MSGGFRFRKPNLTIRNRFAISLALAWAALTCLTALRAQSDPSAPVKAASNQALATSEGASDDQPQLATQLEVESHALREHLKKMRSHAIKYHLSDTPAQTKALGAEWYQLLSTGYKIHERMIKAAMADMRENPKLDSEAAEFLIQVSGRNADADRFDGMLEVVQLLKDHGYTSRPFELCFALTAASQNEYEAALPHLINAAHNLETSMKEVAESKEITNEQRQVIGKKLMETHLLLEELANVERNKSLWEAELKARESDAAGEPLPRVLIETTKGSLEVELFENQAPNTVANFISLCESGFYDTLPFHRVMTHFMAQGGCPNRDGTGGPDYSIRTELDGKTDRGFFRGTLGLAMAQTPDSGGSQFFICYLPRTSLTGKYVAFGRVVEGLNVLSDLSHIDPDEKEAEQSSQALPDEIIRTKVLRKRAHDYTPQTLPKVN